MSGITKEEYRLAIIANCPVPFESALKHYFKDADPYMHDDHVRAEFMAVWAMVQVEYADAVLAELERRDVKPCGVSNEIREDV